MRAANNITSSPCMAMSLCPLPLPASRAYLRSDNSSSPYLPLVTMLEDGISANFTVRVIRWVQRSFPGIYILDLKLTGPQRGGAWAAEEASLERGYALLSPLRLQAV